MTRITVLYRPGRGMLLAVPLSSRLVFVLGVVPVSTEKRFSMDYGDIVRLPVPLVMAVGPSGAPHAWVAYAGSVRRPIVVIHRSFNAPPSESFVVPSTVTLECVKRMLRAHPKLREGTRVGVRAALALAVRIDLDPRPGQVRQLLDNLTTAGRCEERIAPELLDVSAIADPEIRYLMH